MIKHYTTWTHNDLIEAIFNGDEEYLSKELLKDPNCTNSIVYDYGDGIVTLMHIAVEKNHVNICKMLLETTDMNAKSLTIQNTPLMQSCQKNNVDITSIFLSYSAIDINASNNIGHTALIRCIQSNSIECFDLLTNDKRLNVNSNPSPLELSITYCNERFIKRLLTLGARINVPTTKICRRSKNIQSILRNWRSFLPDWTIFNSNIYPQDFIDIAITCMCCFNCIEITNDITIGRDIKRLLIQYVSKVWKTKNNSNKLYFEMK